MIISSRFSLFLIHLWIGSISCAVYHIIPSPSHDCPVESCLTLSSFAANVSQYLESNTSLIFEPGNHTMHSELNITNVAEFSMISHSESTNQSSLHIICEESLLSFFIFEAVDHIYITDLKFFGCKNTVVIIPLFQSTLIKIIASSLVLLGCTFENNEGSITVISAKYSNITVAQTTFSNNTVSSILSYNACNSKFVNSTFISNRGMLVPFVTHDNNYHGQGAIVIVNNSDISIIDTRFVNNSCRASPSLHISNSVVSINKSVFKYNYDSAITFWKCRTVNIFDSVYDGNQGRVYIEDFQIGGAITAYYSVIHIHSSDFKRNIAIFGGAIIIIV